MNLWKKKKQLFQAKKTNFKQNKVQYYFKIIHLHTCLYCNIFLLYSKNELVYKTVDSIMICRLESAIDLFIWAKYYLAHSITSRIVSHYENIWAPIYNFPSVKMFSSRKLSIRNLCQFVFWLGKNLFVFVGSLWYCWREHCVYFQPRCIIQSNVQH